MTDSESILAEINQLEGAAIQCAPLQSLASIARSLLLENQELREAPEVFLDVGEEWPKFGAIPEEERYDFISWISAGKELLPPGDNGYYPWSLARFRAEKAETEALLDLEAMWEHMESRGHKPFTGYTTVLSPPKTA